MSVQTKPIFIIGTGRSGTRMIFKLLSGLKNVEIHHEYACTHIQPLSCRYFMGLLSKDDIKKEMSALHAAAIYYSEADYFIDCSNKLSWIIEPLFELYPNAKFINIVRDGRKVTSSFYHKLNDEIYDDQSVAIMQNWLKAPHEVPMPPPEKKYWWNIPRGSQPYADKFPAFNQYQRICYHWQQTIKTINEAFAKLPAANTATYKLEELTTDKEILKEFLTDTGQIYQEHFYEYMKIPQNVFFPMNFNLAEEELAQFNEICGSTMKELSYASKEVYQVKY